MRLVWVSLGCGLGLAIVQRIANQNGGSVDVSSTRGEGSIFSLILPTAPPEP